jgi:hypothetical protein
MTTPSNFPSVLDTIIALVAVYLALSVLCSHLNELVAGFTQRRGWMLYEGVLNLLMGERDLVDGVYAHPLITASQPDPGGKPKPAEKRYRPSFIDSRTFSMAFWDTMQSTARAQSAAATGLTKSVVAAPDVLFTTLTGTVAELPPSELQKQLVTIVNESQGTYEGLLRATDAWFDRQMDRVSGWYKRYTQLVLLGIAFVAVFGLGIDSMRIASRLYADPATRNALVRAAVNAVPSPAPVPSGAPSPDPGEKAASAAQAVASIDQSFAQLPVDTYLTGVAGGWYDASAQRPWATPLLHLLGLLVTVFAAAAGAPFWFDLLGKLLNVRMAGPKPVSRADPKNNPPPPAP